MTRLKRMLAVVLVVTVAGADLVFGYINSGFRNKREYEEYQRKQGRLRVKELDRAWKEFLERWRESQRLRQEYLQQLGVFEEALRRDPNDLVAIYQRAKFLHYHAQLSLGFTFQNPDEIESDFIQARKDLDHVIAQDPLFAKAYFRRSFLKFLTFDRKPSSLAAYRDVISDLDAAICLDPTYAPSHYHRAELLRAFPGKERDVTFLKEARQSAQAAVDLTANPQAAYGPVTKVVAPGFNAASPDEFRARCCWLLATICASLGDFPAAIQWETEAVKFPLAHKGNRLSLFRSGQADPENPEGEWSRLPVVP